MRSGKVLTRGNARIYMGADSVIFRVFLKALILSALEELEELENSSTSLTKRGVMVIQVFLFSASFYSGIRGNIQAPVLHNTASDPWPLYTCVVKVVQYTNSLSTHES